MEELKMNTNDLRKSAKCVFLACEYSVAKDLSEKLLWAAKTIEDFNGKLNLMESSRKE